MAASAAVRTLALVGLVLVGLFPGLSAAPLVATSPESCSDVHLLRTSPSISTADASEALRLYLDTTRQHEVRPSEVDVPTSLAGRLSHALGGFWDIIFFCGVPPSFSYSMYCAKLVECVTLTLTAVVIILDGLRKLLRVRLVAIELGGGGARARIRSPAHCSSPHPIAPAPGPTSTCAPFVHACRLAGPTWHVTLCQEGVDELARECGPEGLAEYENGTLSHLAVSASQGGATSLAAPDAGPLDAVLQEYEHYTDHFYYAAGTEVVSAERQAFKDERAAVIRQALLNALGTARGPMGNGAEAGVLASLARQRIEAALPADRWNVVIEQLMDGNEEQPWEGQGHYYFSEESLSFRVGTALTVTVYDRRCYHNFTAEGMDEIEEHNEWVGFEETGVDDEGEAVYGNRMRPSDGQAEVRTSRSKSSKK
jgi:hypothetical protein